MNQDFYNNITRINSSLMPIRTAWELSLESLGIGSLISERFTSALLSNISTLDNNNPYHDHYHLAHVLYGATYLLKNEGLSLVDIELNAVPLLLAALFHDGLHPGRSNQYPYELENLSLCVFKEYGEKENLRQIWDNNSLSAKLPWQEVVDAVGQLIPATEFIHEPKQVAEDYRNQIPSSDNGIKIFTLKMLLIESDILLSCLPLTGYQQTAKILTENHKPMAHQDILNNWKGFLPIALKHHYVSQASCRLGIKENIHLLIPIIEGLTTTNESETIHFLEKKFNKSPKIKK